MGRVRFSRAEAHDEATRRAAEFVAGRADRDRWWHVSTTPDGVGPPSRSSKHPVVWVAMYAPVTPAGGAIDGGELFVVVDLESGAVAVRE